MYYLETEYSLKFIAKSPIDIKSALGQVMTWPWTGDLIFNPKSLSFLQVHSKPAWNFLLELEIHSIKVSITIDIKINSLWPGDAIWLR